MRRTLLLLVIAAIVIYVGPQYLDYRQARQALPPGVTLGGVHIPGKTTAEAVENVRALFESPILVFHGDRRIVLRAEEIGFKVDAEAMVEQGQAFGRGPYAWRDFFFYLIDRPPLENHVPVLYSYDRARLGAWLQKLAETYDNDPTPGYARLSTLSWVEGRPGHYTDLNESAIRILAAFQSPNDRQANLVLRETPPLPPDFDALEKVIRERLEQFPGIYSLYFQHLPTGQSIDIDGDTAFAGMSTVKIPILLKLYYDYDLPFEPRITNWISDTVRSTTASNAAANALLYYIGDGNALAGAREVTEFVRELGFDNTFIAIPYDSDLTPPVIRTPANTDPEYNTYPDPAMQTTPTDIGVMLAEIGRCAEGEGTLIAAYPDRITPEECQDLIGWLEQNPMGWLIKYGVPKDARVAHKHGYAADTQGDVALIYGPEGPYVLAIYVYMYGWVVWDYSNPLMNDISRLIWNFFLFRQGKPQLPPFDRSEQTGQSPG
ncbi:MAG: hypothetical protein D6775_10975 [Caldilineae bacterium]|nr:MAG: hypothetical protein D6775_10975 [Caldilineae bacterium]